MKIVHLCLGNYFIDNYSYQENILTKYHVKMGYDVVVIADLYTFDENGLGVIKGKPKTYFNSDGVKIIRLGYRNPRFIGQFFRKFNGVKQAIESEAPDIIFCHNLQFGDTGVIVNYLKRHPTVVLYADNHGDYINSARNWVSKYIKHKLLWKYYVKKIEPYIKIVYGVTPSRCRFLKEMYNIASTKIDFLPMGVDDSVIPQNRSQVREVIRKELSISEDQIIIMTGGKIELRKNTHLLFEAFERLSDHNVHLVVCGTFTPEVVFLEQKMRRNNRVHLLGWCSPERVMNVMVASDFVCFPGTHSTLWEQSVGLGLPAIFKYWKEMDHVNINGNCIFVTGEDVGEILNAINLLSNRENYLKYKALSESAATSFLYSNIAKKAIGLS